MSKEKKKKKSLFETFLYKYVLVKYTEKEKKSLSKEIFLIAGLVFAFSSILIFLNIQKVEYSSVLNFVYVVVLGCCINFYREKKNSSIKENKPIFSLILKIVFYVLIFFIFLYAF